MTRLFRKRHYGWLAIVLAAAYCPGAWPQTPRPGVPVLVPGAPVFDELEGASRTSFERADAFIQGGQGQAIELLRQQIDANGDKIVATRSVPIVQLSGFSQHVTAHEYGMIQLSRLRTKFPQEFSAYRRQFDSVAARWLEQGIANRQEQILRRLTRELFLSQAGDDALLALGEFALERGNYNAARNYWERIHTTLRFPVSDIPRLQTAIDRPLWIPFRGTDVNRVWPLVAPVFTTPQDNGSKDTQPGTQPAEISPLHDRLVYPDTDLPLAELRARLALVSILEGNPERAAIEIAILRQLDGHATGTIAGRQGNLVQLLESFLAESRRWPKRRPVSDWTTYAGASSRQHVSEFELPDISKPLWTLNLPRQTFSQELLTANRVCVAERSDGILAYHPVIAGKRVIVQCGYERNQLAVCDRETGQLLLPAAPKDQLDAPETGRGIFGVPRFTPTIMGDTLFIRSGISLAVAPANRARVSRPARLEALSLSAEGKLLWDFSPSGTIWGDGWTLGGPPVTDGDQLYMTLIRRAPLRVETHLVALDLLDGRVRWRRFVSAAEPAVDDIVSLLTHTVLTLDQGVIYCNTNQGVVAACDTDGNIKWLATYPRTALASADPDRNDLHFYRDSNPCLLFHDLVIVAPTDCNRLFALDANTGLPVWVTQENVGADVVHFLGVGGNNLIASGECLYWFDVYSGRFVGQFPGPFLPAPGFARPSPRGYGRGMLVGSHVYWPTYESILVFEQRPIFGQNGGEPAPVRELPLAASGITGGNLIAANGVMLIAGAEQLVAFRTLPQTPHPQ